MRQAQQLLVGYYTKYGKKRPVTRGRKRTRRMPELQKNSLEDFALIDAQIDTAQSEDQLDYVVSKAETLRQKFEGTTMQKMANDRFIQLVKKSRKKAMLLGLRNLAKVLSMVIVLALAYFGQKQVPRSAAVVPSSLPALPT